MPEPADATRAAGEEGAQQGPLDLEKELLQHQVRAPERVLLGMTGLFPLLRPLRVRAAQRPHVCVAFLLCQRNRQQAVTGLHYLKVAALSIHAMAGSCSLLLAACLKYLPPAGIRAHQGRRRHVALVCHDPSAFLMA